MATVSYPHIEIREDGKPIIVGEGFRFKVRILVEAYLNGATVASLQEAHPMLSPSQIHSALAYYYDHKAAMDLEIEELRKFAEEVRPQLENPAIKEKLRQAMQQRRDRP